MRWLSKSTSLSSRRWHGLPWTCSALLGAGLVLSSCQAQMTQNVGCNVDSDCQFNLHCDPTGHCVTPPTYSKVTVAKLGDGDGTITSLPAGIDCGSTCSAMFADGEPLTLTATANPGSVVAGFSVSCTSSTTTCTFTPSDPTAPEQVLVNFALGTALPAAPLCNSSGYCWENPRPQGNGLNKVVVVGPNDEWAVGDAGTILHRTSTATTLAVSGVNRNLYSIWASGTELYAVGQGGIILHTSGGAWAAESSSVTTDLFDVAGTGANVFAVGAGGVILRRNAGGFWAKDTSPTVRDLHGLTAAAAGEMYAVGDSATVVRYNGSTWSAGTDAVLHGTPLTAVAAAAAGSPLYMTSGIGEIFRLSGGAYTLVSPSLAFDLRGIAVSPLGIFAAGQGTGGGVILRSTDGTSWSSQGISAQATLNGVGAGSGEVMVVGDTGAMLRSDGSPWTPLSSGRTVQLRAVHAVDAQHGWAVGLGGAILLWNGSYWTSVALAGALPNFYGVFTVSATDAWAVGAAGAVWRWNGVAWSPQASGTTANLRAVWAAAANRVYVVGDGGVAQLWDGSAWSQVGAGNGVNLTAVSGSGPSDVWATGDSGVVLHATGAGFAVVPGGLGTTATAGGVWAAAPNNVWFAADTSMYRFDGVSFSKYSPAVTGLRAVSGVGAELWAVGNAGALVHWNGASWDVIDSGTKRDFYSIFLGPQKQWLAGDFGTLLSKPR